ncbi:hypothetical protein PM8797T_05305 [Gimesia maris DSM 8797]|nr:hypothetical protein PM8797T_05305 [Gimesia maris DSM 8797]
MRQADPPTLAGFSVKKCRFSFPGAIIRAKSARKCTDQTNL